MVWWASEKASKRETDRSKYASRTSPLFGPRTPPIKPKRKIHYVLKGSCPKSLSDGYRPTSHIAAKRSETRVRRTSCSTPESMPRNHYSRPDPFSVDFGRETPKFRFEFCRGFLGGFFPPVFSKEKGPKNPPKNPPQNSQGTLFGKIPRGFLQKPFLDSINKGRNATGENPDTSRGPNSLLSSQKKGPNSLPTACIYIYAVELKTGPRFGVSSVKNWSKSSVKNWSNFFLLFFPQFYSVFWHF